jgi:putative acetyltransferase
VRIRPETEADAAAIRRINEEAFGRSVEADVVDAIRASEGFVPDLSLIALSEGQALGHVLLSYVHVDPGAHPVLQLGPLAVLPAHQRRGIGSALMRHALRAADRRGEPLVLVEGAPAYYERFGFEPSGRIGIAPPRGVAPAYFMARTLGSYDPALRGQAVYSQAFLAAG